MTYRLAVLCDSTETGGAERFLAYLLAELPDAVEVTVLGQDAAVLQTIARSRPGTTAMPIAPTVRAAITSLRRVQPDVVHANLPALTSCRAMVLAALALRLRVVLVDHLPTPGLTWRGRALQRVLTRLCAARVAVGETSARLVERHAGLPADSVSSISNGVARRAPAADIAPGQTCSFGFLGRLEDQKGLDILLAALALVPNATVEIMGSGTREEQLRRTASSPALRGRVRFTAASFDTSAFWDRIGVFVLPSRDEGMPLVVLEAVQAGRPVLAAAVGSMAQLAHDPDVTLFAPEDVAALAQALDRFTADPELRQRAREAALCRAASMWTAAEMAAAYDGLYRSVLRRG